MKTSKLLLILGIGIIMGACSSSGSNKEKKTPTAASIGQPSEVLLIMDPSTMASDLKDSLQGILECDVPGLNQKESFFRVSRIPESIYKGEMAKMHSKVFVKVNEQAQKCDMMVAYNVDAVPQIQVKVEGPSVDALRPYLFENADRLRQLVLDHQLKTHQSYLKSHHSKNVSKELEKRGYQGVMPEELRWVKTGKDFFWVSSGSSDKQINFVFYRYASDGSELGDELRMAQLRDSVLQINIPGSQPDQWVETVWEKEMPVVFLNRCIRDKQQVNEMRGLWQMRHGAMGGPFVSYSTYDEAAGQVVVLESFIFAPSADKRDLMRTLEAGMRTIKAKP